MPSNKIKVAPSQKRLGTTGLGLHDDQSLERASYRLASDVSRVGLVSQPATLFIPLSSFFLTHWGLKEEHFQC